MVFTVIGTVTHEWGHSIVAESLGYEAHVNYRSTGFENTTLDAQLNSLYKNCLDKKNITQGSACDEFKLLLKEKQKAVLFVYAGGPLQTILTGSIGLFLLFVFKNSFYETKKLNYGQWALVFLSLFWLRQVFNCLLIVWNSLVNGNLGRGDEMNLSVLFHFHPLTLNLITGLIGTVVFLIVLFRFIPTSERLTFLSAGFFGGVTGFILWFEYLGLILMP